MYYLPGNEDFILTIAYGYFLSFILPYVEIEKLTDEQKTFIAQEEHQNDEHSR